MAPSSGLLLMSKVLKAGRVAVSNASAYVRQRLPEKATANASAHPIPVYARNHPVHPLAQFKQARSQKTRWFSSQTRTLISSAAKGHSGPRIQRSNFPISKISKTVQQGGISPFASTLRPNLTGGALPRTAGGYSLGGAGKARLFGHSASCQAQVVNNVSAGVRAFFVGEGKVKYDGVDPVTGEQRFRSISTTEDKMSKQLKRSTVSAKGTTLEFRIAPTVTAMSPILSYHKEQSVDTLQSPDLLTSLSSDFARSLRSLSLILNDLNRLSKFGDLPVSLSQDGTTITVRFPGCDSEVVTRLCDEVGVTRGLIKEDEAWNQDKEVQMALLFPFAPTVEEGSDSILSAERYFQHKNLVEEEVWQERQDWRDILSPSMRSVHSRDQENESLGDMTLRSFMLNTASPSGYESLEDPDDAWTSPSPRSDLKSNSRAHSTSQDYEGVEGIYKFLQVCDESRR